MDWWDHKICWLFGQMSSSYINVSANLRSSFSNTEMASWTAESQT